MRKKQKPYKSWKQNDEVDAIKAECVRMHTELNYGVTAISKRVGRNKSLVRKWLKAAGVYQVGGRTKAPIVPMRGAKESGYTAVLKEMQKAVVHWKKMDGLWGKKTKSEKIRENHMRTMATPHRRIKFYARKRVRTAFKQALVRKSISTSRLIGCTGNELVEHIRNQFKPGMTLDNHGLWHIDHIRPLASFDLTDGVQVRTACHYSNLQPLWAKDNIIKRDHWKPTSLVSPEHKI